MEIAPVRQSNGADKRDLFADLFVNWILRVHHIDKPLKVECVNSATTQQKYLRGLIPLHSLQLIVVKQCDKELLLEL